MSTRQITRTCHCQHRPSLSLLSVLSGLQSNVRPLPPPFLLPFAKHDRSLHVRKRPSSTPATAACSQSLTFRRTYARASVKMPVGPALGPEFIGNDRVRPPYDDEITARNPTFIDENGKFVGILPIEEVLRSYDRSRFHLIWLEDPDGTPDEAPGHIVKLFSKEALRERIEAEKAAKTRQKKAEKDPRNIAKELQLSWGIDLHDLEHRLVKVGQFLKKGNKVDVMIAKKKRAAKVSESHMETVVAKIRETMEVNGGREYKKTEGEIGGQVLMFLQVATSAEKQQEANSAAAVASSVDAGDDGVKSQAHEAMV